MPQTLTCPRGHAVPFADHDRGGGVYCPVCGVVCQVPAADDGAARCRNGHRVPVAADGTPDAYCPTCGVAVEAPAAPARPGRVAAFSAAGAAAATAAVAGTAACPRCAHAFPFTVAESVGTVYCPQCGTGVAVGEPRAVGARPADTAITPLRAGRRGRSRRALVALGLLATVLAGAGYVVWQHPEAVPLVGGALPWNRAPIGSDAAEAPPPPPPPADPPRRPGEVITLAMIEELPRRTDRRAARDEAGAWRVALAGAGVPATDPRRVLLEKVIVALRAESQKTGAAAAPPAAPPAQKSAQGSGEVVRLLEQARERATPERTTEAMELRAKALFLAPRVPQGQFRAGDADRLKGLEDEVTRLILQARGRRAAADAGRCLTEGDDAARRRLVDVGREILPEFTDRADCKAAFQAIERLAGERAPRAAGSTFGRAVLFRCDYEEAMEKVRRAESAAGVAAAARAHARGPTADEARRLTEFVFEALDDVVTRATDPSAADRDRARWTDEARRALDAAEPWRADPRWGRLDAPLRAAPGEPAP